MPLLTTGAGAYQAIGGGGFSGLVFKAAAVPSVAGAVATATAQPIGTAGSFTTRRVIVSIACSGINGGISSVTIGGVTATSHVSNITGQGDAAIFSADVPTGSTANIVMTAGGTLFNTPVFGVYTVDDALLISTTPSTASGNVTAGTSITSGSFTQTASGFVIASNCLVGAAGGTGTSISGFTTDGFGGAGNKEYLGSLAPVSSTVTGTVASNWTTSFNGGLVVAAWR